MRPNMLDYIVDQVCQHSDDKDRSFLSGIAVGLYSISDDLSANPACLARAIQRLRDSNRKENFEVLIREFFADEINRGKQYGGQING